MLGKEWLINERIIRAARKACNGRKIKAEAVCALADYLSNGKAFIEISDAQFRNQMAHAREVGLKPSEVEADICEFFENETRVPNFTFNPDDWQSVSSLQLKGLTTTSRFLLACDVGIFKINAKDYIFESPLVSNPAAWGDAIRELATRLNLQLDHFVRKLEKLSASLEKNDDIFSAICRQRRGIKHQIVSPMQEVAELAGLQRKYKQAIKDQEDAETKKQKEAGRGTGAIFGNTRKG